MLRTARRQAPTRLTGAARQWAIYGLRLAFGIAGMIACFTLPDVSALPDAIAWIIPFCLFVTFLLNVIGTIVLPAMVSRQSLEVGRVRLTLRELPAFVHDS